MLSTSLYRTHNLDADLNDANEGEAHGSKGARAPEANYDPVDAMAGDELLSP